MSESEANLVPINCFDVILAGHHNLKDLLEDKGLT